MITSELAAAGASQKISYCWKLVPLLALGFGLVGLDRFVLIPLFPVMTKELRLTYQDLGLASGVLALTWGIAAIFCGRLADRFGTKSLFILALFSLLSSLLGLVSGLGSPLAIRALMGIAGGLLCQLKLEPCVWIERGRCPLPK
jgi:MFS family permease